MRAIAPVVKTAYHKQLKRAILVDARRRGRPRHVHRRLDVPLQQALDPALRRLRDRGRQSQITYHGWPLYTWTAGTPIKKLP